MLTIVEYNGRFASAREIGNKVEGLWLPATLHFIDDNFHSTVEGLMRKASFGGNAGFQIQFKTDSFTRTLSDSSWYLNKLMKLGYGVSQSQKNIERLIAGYLTN